MEWNVLRFRLGDDDEKPVNQLTEEQSRLRKGALLADCGVYTRHYLPQSIQGFAIARQLEYCS